MAWGREREMCGIRESEKNRGREKEVEGGRERDAWRGREKCVVWGREGENVCCQLKRTEGED